AGLNADRNRAHVCTRPSTQHLVAGDRRQIQSGRDDRRVWSRVVSDDRCGLEEPPDTHDRRRLLVLTEVRGGLPQLPSPARSAGWPTARERLLARTRAEAGEAGADGKERSMAARLLFSSKSGCRLST